MPIKSPYTLGPGELYIDDTVIEVKGNGCIPDYTVEKDDIDKIVRDNITISTSDSMNFECTCNIDRFGFYKLIGLYDLVVNYCPNRRVVHLIKYGKTNRVRKKNFRRACIILEKYLHN